MNVITTSPKATRYNKSLVQNWLIAPCVLYWRRSFKSIPSRAGARVQGGMASAGTLSRELVVPIVTIIKTAIAVSLRGPKLTATLILGTHVSLFEWYHVLCTFCSPPPGEQRRRAFFGDVVAGSKMIYSEHWKPRPRKWYKRELSQYHGGPTRLCSTRALPSVTNPAFR